MPKQAYSPKKEIGFLLSVGVAVAIASAPVSALAVEADGAAADDGAAIEQLVEPDDAQDGPESDGEGQDDAEGEDEQDGEKGDGLAADASADEQGGAGQADAGDSNTDANAAVEGNAEGQDGADGEDDQLDDDPDEQSELTSEELAAALARHEEDVANGTAVADGTYVIEAGVGAPYVLDVASNGGDGANVQLYKGNATAAQRWDVAFDATTGLYSIRKSGTDLYLGVAPGATAASKANVGVWSCAQRWSVRRSGLAWVLSYAPSGDGGPEVVLDVASARKANGANVQLYESNDTNAQRFYFTGCAGLGRAEDALRTATGEVVEGAALLDVAEGAYVVRSANDGSFAVDVRSASLSEGANVQLYRSNGTGAQRVWIHQGTDGFCTLWVMGTGRVLGVAGAAGSGSGTNVRQTSAVDARSQWAARRNADGTVSFVNRATGLLLDVSANSMRNGANVQGYRDNGTSAQRFALAATEAVEAATALSDYHGIYELHCVASTGYVLDVRSASTSSGAKVQVWSDNDSQAQRFQLVKAGRDSQGRQLYRIRTAASGGWLTGSSQGVQVTQEGSSSTLSSADTWYFAWDGTGLAITNSKTGNVLDVRSASYKNGTAAQTYASNGTAAQHFALQRAWMPAIPSGYYLIASGLSSSCYLGASGTNVQMTSGSGNIRATNLWSFRRSGNGYVIVNYKTGKVLDVASASTASGANVQLYKANGTNAQLWYACIEDGGRIGFVNAGSGKALDVSGGSTKNGANVQQYNGNGTKSQQWTLGRFAGNGSGYIIDGKIYYLDSSTGVLQALPVYLNQTNSKWGSIKIGLSTIGKSGCLVTAVASVLQGYGTSVTPVTVGKYAYSVGEYNKRFVGTSGKGAVLSAQHWGYTVELVKSKAALKSALASGHAVIGCMNPGSFCPSGITHAVTFFKSSGNKTYAYDPYWSSHNGWYSVDAVWAQRSTDSVDIYNGAVFFAIY